MYIQQSPGSGLRRTVVIPFIQHPSALLALLHRHRRTPIREGNQVNRVVRDVNAALRLDLLLQIQKAPRECRS